MRKFSVFTLITIAALMLGASAASATHDKILTMAKDTVFPEAKLSYKPHPDSRTMFQELRHVTIGLEAPTAMA